jgi:hypothetical protein|nr:MAG TPA: tail protein [Caudoviricetes sp.]
MVEDIILQNITTSDKIEMSMTATPDYVLENVDWGVIESTHHSYKYINQNGVYVTGTALGTRTVTITGWVIADNDTVMTDRKRKLNKFINPQQEIKLFYKSYTISFLPNTTIKYSTANADNNEVICKFKIEGLCAHPLFNDIQTIVISASQVEPTFHFPLEIEKWRGAVQTDKGVTFGVKQKNRIFNIVNKGDVPTGMQILFKANGVVTNPSITNIRTQSYFKLNKTMVNKEEITVNTVTGSKKITGKQDGEEVNYFKYRDLNSDWLQLEVGDNVLQFDADANVQNLDVYIYFNDSYLEVQECH